MVHLARFAGLPWDCILTAENARCYKPRPETYQTAVALLGLRPAEVMMVAAHNYDLAAAPGRRRPTALAPPPTPSRPAPKAARKPPAHRGGAAGSGRHSSRAPPSTAPGRRPTSRPPPTGT